MTFASKFSNDELLNFLSPNKNDFGTDRVKEASAHFGVKTPSIYRRLENKFFQDAITKTSKGNWTFTVREVLEKTYDSAPAVQSKVAQKLVPDKDANFVPFGNFNDVKKVIKSKIFYPLFITGLSGNGKTLGIEQACSQLNRELIRVCLLYTSPSPRDATLSRMPSSA